MKKLLLIILLSVITLLSYSQINWYKGKDPWIAKDKGLHIAVETFIQYEGTSLLMDNGVSRKYAEPISIVASIGVGLFKEFAIDAQPSYKDITADIVGIAAGFFLSRQVEKWQKNKSHRIQKRMERRVKWNL